ncbi:MAG: DUF362 domain-containing protein [Candidatus Latescibacterota bacterium]
MEQIEGLVRRACELGGLPALLARAAAAPRGDTLWVAVKPNIVDLKGPGSGVVTDWRVVRAIVRLVAELEPGARISIAEGGAWVPPEREEVRAKVPFAPVGDGFAVAGYRQLLADPALAAVDLGIVDLNFDDPQPMPVPGGGCAQDTFHVPRTIRACDVLIDVPVLKIIGSVQMTVAMKNLIGTAPGMVYGWAKGAGYPPEGGHPGIPHHHAVLGETITDLTSLAGVDFAVVDAIVGMEKARTDDDGGRPVRLNAVVAGADIVAVDAVCAQLMGLNPADIEYIALGERRGLGLGRPEGIRVVGQSIAQVGRRFEKYPAAWGDSGERGHYGQGNRLWLLRGPLPLEQGREDLVDPEAGTPVAGAAGWSQPVYFHDDLIDLDRYYGNPAACVAYAYCQMEAPAEAPAEMWLGSDEGLRVWLNGERVYQFSGRRRHRLPNERVPVSLRAGANACLVEVRQTHGPFSFSLKVCERETDPRYDGRTLLGLRYCAPSTDATAVREVAAVAARASAQWFDEHYVAAGPGTTGRIALTAFLPGQVESPWIGLDAPSVWGRAMHLEGSLDGGLLVLTTENVAAFHLDMHGLLSRLAGDLRVTVDGQEVDLGSPAAGARVRLEAGASKHGPGVHWGAVRAQVEPVADASIAQVPDSLRHSPAVPGQHDTPMGNWFTDAIAWATGADVVLQNRGGIRTGLGPGPLQVPALFALNFPDEIYTFGVSGSELLAILEHDLRDGNDALLQVCGLQYSFDRTRPQGARMVRSSIAPRRTYTVAAEDFLCLRATRFFGREVDWRESGVHVVDAHVRYAQHQGRVTAPEGGRIREVR